MGWAHHAWLRHQKHGSARLARRVGWGMGRARDAHSDVQILRIRLRRVAPPSDARVAGRAGDVAKDCALNSKWEGREGGKA